MLGREATTGLAALAAAASIAFACSTPYDAGARNSSTETDAGGVDATAPCRPKTCPELGASCGTESDGCGKALDCGACTTAGEVCVQKKCQCQPKTCEARGAECGTVPDGCGNKYDCGSCATNPAGPNCGGAGPNKCGTGVCTPLTCAGLCGQVSDGCGAILDCPGCPAPQICGGGGTANVCGCSPTTCATQGKNCDSIPDGCGGSLSCGTCSTPDSCGGGGAPNVCGCTPLTCADVECGNVADGCGGIVRCGVCDGGGCFAAATRITMADGSLAAIERVQVGDWVRSVDPITGIIGRQRVVRHDVHGRQASRAGIVVVDGILHATRNHPIRVGGKLVSMDQLREGDPIMISDGAGGVVAKRVGTITLVRGGIATHDLVLEDATQSYFAEGLVVATKPNPN